MKCLPRLWIGSLLAFVFLCSLFSRRSTDQLHSPPPITPIFCPGRQGYAGGAPHGRADPSNSLGLGNRD